LEQHTGILGKAFWDANEQTMEEAEKPLKREVEVWGRTTNTSFIQSVIMLPSPVW
jgi:hypothetical protein